MTCELFEHKTDKSMKVFGISKLNMVASDEVDVVLNQSTVTLTAKAAKPSRPLAKVGAANYCRTSDNVRPNLANVRTKPNFDRT